jgi:hypothetical protein
MATTEEMIEIAGERFKEALRMMFARQYMAHAFDLGSVPDGTVFSVFVVVDEKEVIDLLLNAANAAYVKEGEIR